jgi:hypothetical protein
VRILTDDGARHIDLLGEVAGLLAHDVLVGPEGAVIRHAGRGESGPLHAVPLDRATRRVTDWLVVQPPDLATPLPGWFTVEYGLVRPRKGVVGLPLSGGLVLATRADFVTRRATAYQLDSTSEGLITVAVTARAGGFLVGDYSGTQRVYSGGQLAALLGDLPLYGSDLRLWLTWPSDLDEQRSLTAQAEELAETSGATVWTPPPGGSAELVDGRRDLRALDQAGDPVAWCAHRGRFTRPAALRTTSDGLLVPARDRPRVVLPSGPGPDTPPPPTPRLPDRPYAPPLEVAAAAPVACLPRPVLVVEDRRAPAYGPAWLPRRQAVNAVDFHAFVALPSANWSNADGIPGAELFLIAFLDPKSAPHGSHLVRVTIGPGGAIPMTAIRAHVPARLQHLRSLHEAYLLPAARLNRVSTLETFYVDGPGLLRSTGECDGASLRIRCTASTQSIAGLPADVRRWPTAGTRRAYALVPATRVRLPRGWLRLYRKPPPVQSGRLLLELRVPRERAIDVWATADALAPLTRVYTQAERLRTAGVELILGSRSYGRVRVRRAYLAEDGGWRRGRRLPGGPLPVALPPLQSPGPT